LCKTDRTTTTNFSSACAVTVVIFGHFNRSFFTLLTTFNFCLIFPSYSRLSVILWELTLQARLPDQIQASCRQNNNFKAPKHIKYYTKAKENGNESTNFSRLKWQKCTSSFYTYICQLPNDKNTHIHTQSFTPLAFLQMHWCIVARNIQTAS